MVLDFLGSGVTLISGCGMSCWIIGVSFSKGSTISGNVGGNSGIDSTPGLISFIWDSGCTSGLGVSIISGFSLIFGCGIEVLSCLLRLNRLKNPSCFDFSGCGIGSVFGSSSFWLISGCGISIFSGIIFSISGSGDGVSMTSGIVSSNVFSGLVISGCGVLISGFDSTSGWLRLNLLKNPPGSVSSLPVLNLLKNPSGFDSFAWGADGIGVISGIVSFNA